MTFNEALDYIHSLLKFGIHPGLSRMDTLLQILGNPHKNIKCVHVAGTNGKGSTSTAISNVYPISLKDFTKLDTLGLTTSYFIIIIHSF